MQCFLGIGRTGRVFHLFCLFHLREWNSWKSKNSWNSGDRFRWTLDRNRMISVPFELEWVELGILIPGILLPEKSQKECDLRRPDKRTENVPAA